MAITVRLGNVYFGVDLIITLYMSIFTGESNTPVGVGLILAAGFGLAIVVVVIIFYFPVEVVVRNVGVINVLFAVASIG